MNKLIFLFNLGLTNILFSYIIAKLLIKVFGKKIKPKEAYLYSFGLAPALTVTILWYLLMLTPHMPYFFYFLFITTVYLAIFFLMWKTDQKNFIQTPKKFYKQIQDKFLKRDFLNTVISMNHYDLLMIFFCTSYIFAWLFISLNHPIYSHDMTNYAIQGKIFYTNREIKYEKVLYYQDQSFSYRARHGYDFPLILTWENITDNLFNDSQDYYFRSIPGYYWLLAVILFYYWLAKIDKKLAFFGTLLLLSVPGFARLAYVYSIDGFRIYFMLLAFIFTLKAVREFNWENLIFLGIISGIAANSHSLNVAVIGIYMVILFLSQKISKNTLSKMVLCLILLLLFGGLHYVLDTFWGTGWIFTRLQS